MRNKWKLSTPLVAVAAALVIVTAGFASTARHSSSTALLRVATTAGVTTWDPIKSFSTEVLYMANIYEPLVYANPPGSSKPFRAGLATNWGRSKDGKTWTFTLRQGVKFHNGERLTAQAVKDSLDAARKRGGASFIWAPVDLDHDAERLHRRLQPLLRVSDDARRRVRERRLDRLRGGAQGRRRRPELLRVRQGVRHRPVHAQVVRVGQAGRARAEQGLLGRLEEQPVQERRLPDHARGDRAAAGAPVGPGRRRRLGPGREHREAGQEPQVQGHAGCLVAELPGVLQHEAAAARQRPRAPCARVRDPVQGHPHGRGRRLRHPVPQRRAEGDLPLQPDDAPVHAEPGQGEGAPRAGRAQGRRLQPRPHLRRRERGRGAVRTADQGRVQEDRRHGERQVAALQPAVEAREGRPEQGAGHLPAPLLADLQRRRVRQPVVAVPLEQEAVLQPQLHQEPALRQARRRRRRAARDGQEGLAGDVREGDDLAAGRVPRASSSTTPTRSSWRASRSRRTARSTSTTRSCSSSTRCSRPARASRPGRDRGAVECGASCVGGSSPRS